MKIAYFDCASGISGDMVLGAFVDAGLEVARLSNAIEGLGIAGLHLTASKVTRLGIAATKVDVVAPEQDSHRHLSDIEKLIDESPLPDAVKKTAKAIFAIVAEAEAKVHNSTVEKVHFHEVGALDSIADIVGAAAAVELLGIDKLVFSAIPTGSGTVKCAHGVLPVPAPATAEILTGVPLGESVETGELTTPTGAAIAKKLAGSFGAMPAMTVSSVGYGAGTREGKKTPNILRVFLGEESRDKTPGDILVIETAIDDMTGEAISAATEAVFAAGALDVFVTPIFMKKGRPAQLLTVILEKTRRDALVETLFRETTTFGVRISPWDRETLAREIVEADGPYGKFRLKTGSYRGRVVSATPEFDDAKRIADERSIPFRRVYERLQAAGASYLESDQVEEER